MTQPNATGKTSPRVYWKYFRIPIGAAVAFSVYAMWLSRSTDGAAIERLGITLPILVVLYFATALYVGLILYLFGKWATTRFRGTVLGFLSGLALAVLLNYTIIGMKVLPRPLSGVKLLVYVAVMGLFPGAFLGALYWEKSDDAAEE